ncbi:hypothetical protein WISP_142308 [Willisornis vidua]|uniref:Uncharacterized protein n=1 Tax=Willisornis vidua TaxID=1566151 RepID=A0ABQ9CLS2_9PASS|nr:hypothetical protein WISP_142308 [Willisornis vidua]
MKFSKGKCQVLAMRRNNPMHQYVLETTSWETALQNGPKNSGRLQLIHEPETGPCYVEGQVCQNIASRSREVILLLYSELVRRIRSTVYSDGFFTAAQGAPDTSDYQLGGVKEGWEAWEWFCLHTGDSSNPEEDQNLDRTVSATLNKTVTIILTNSFSVPFTLDSGGPRDAQHGG